MIAEQQIRRDHQNPRIYSALAITRCQSTEDNRERESIHSLDPSRSATTLRHEMQIIKVHPLIRRRQRPRCQSSREEVDATYTTLSVKLLPDKLARHFSVAPASFVSLWRVQGAGKGQETSLITGYFGLDCQYGVSSPNEWIKEQLK